MKISERLLKGKRVSAFMVNGEGESLGRDLAGYFQGIEDGFLLLSDKPDGASLHMFALDYIAGVSEEPESAQ